MKNPPKEQLFKVKIIKMLTDDKEMLEPAYDESSKLVVEYLEYLIKYIKKIPIFNTKDDSYLIEEEIKKTL